MCKKYNNYLLNFDNQPQLENFAKQFATFSNLGDIICLEGNLGAGKTVFARSFIRQIAQQPNLLVPSPTFTIVQPYENIPIPIWHFDLYRIEQANEISEIGLEEAFAYGISLIEWSQNLGSWYPKNSIVIKFCFSNNDNTNDNSKNDHRILKISCSNQYYPHITEFLMSNA